MTWISLVCLLALSSSAFGGPGYGGYSGSSFPQVPSIMTTMREFTQPQPSFPTPLPAQTGYGQQQRSLDLTSGYGGSVSERVLPVQTGYGGSFSDRVLPVQPSIQNGYGGSIESRPTPRIFPTQGYGGYGSSFPSLQSDQTPPPQPMLTPADMLCQGQVAETVIPVEDNRKFVVCLGNNRGALLSCPKGLFYHTTSRRCERKLGPLENVCASQPCLYGGQCVPTESWYQCQCAPGYDGHLCELDAHMCQTQQPCGSSPDSRCQSFRGGAALPWICIFQDGQAYGFSATQIQRNPCQGTDGPIAIAGNDKGFIMCDGERMHVESCPGGTVWDDLNKACTWPDMQGVVGVPQQEQSSGYGQTRTIVSESTPYGGGYGQTRTLPTESTSYGGGYGATVTMPRRIHHQKPKFFEQSFAQPSRGYGGQQEEKSIELQPQGGYGGQQEMRILPNSMELQPQGGYGGQQEMRILPNSMELQPQGGYGGQQEMRILPNSMELQPQGGYGGQQEMRILPKSMELQPQGGYGGQQEMRPLPKRMELRPQGGYGGQQEMRTLPKPMELRPQGGYGGQQEMRVLPKPMELQPTGGYGGQQESRQIKQSSGY